MNQNDSRQNDSNLFFFKIEDLNKELSEHADHSYEELLNVCKSLSNDMIQIKTGKKVAKKQATAKLRTINKLSKKLIELLK